MQGVHAHPITYHGLVPNSLELVISGDGQLDALSACAVRPEAIHALMNYTPVPCSMRTPPNSILERVWYLRDWSIAQSG